MRNGRSASRQNEDPQPPSGARTRPPGFEFSERPRAAGIGPTLPFSILRESCCFDDFPVWLSGGAARGWRPAHFRGRWKSSAGRHGRASRRALGAPDRAAAENPRARAGELPILTARETQASARRPQPHPDGASGLPLRARAVRGTRRTHPGCAGVVFGEERLTYGELNARANALAWQLRTRGVGPDVRVGLSLDRSAEMIVAMLAILKAGGAYVPVNPEHPAERGSALQLARSASRLVITRSAWLDKFAEFPGETDLPRPRPAAHRRTRDAQSGAARRSGGPRLRDAHVGLERGFPRASRSGTRASPTTPDSSPATCSESIRPPAPSLAFATVSTTSADLGNTSIFPIADLRRVPSRRGVREPRWTAPSSPTTSPGTRSTF